MIKAQGTVETVEMLQLENQDYCIRPPKKKTLLSGDLSVRGPFTLCMTDDRRGDNRREQFRKVVVKEGWSPIRMVFHQGNPLYIHHTPPLQIDTSYFTQIKTLYTDQNISIHSYFIQIQALHTLHKSILSHS